MSEANERGWRSRGYLPHYDCPGGIQCITFRLADSLPQELQLRRAAALSREERVRWMRDAEAELDRGSGSCWLRQAACAETMHNAVQYFDGERYKLLAWVIMPNHVHVVLEILAGFPLPGILHSWKSYGAKMINRALGRSGQVFQDEYFDRLVRNEEHLHNALLYTELNPVKAGLCRRAEDFHWGSASLRVTGS